MNRILFVDDERNILDAYKRTLIKYFDIVTADSGAAALEIIGKDHSFKVIISDYKMPKMNGVELLEKVRGIAPEIIQIMLTGQADMQAIINLINKGKIFRFLTKPCSHEDILKNINDAIRQYELLTAEKELLGKTLGGSIKVLTDLLALAKPQAFNKTQRIRNFAKKILSELKLQNSWQIEIASMLSQIGCVTIPDEILKKIYRGVTLSDDENIMFSLHPSIGADMIKGIPRLDKVAEIIRHQEKNFDGSGFPVDEVKEEQIPEGARILKIVIDFDSMVSGGVEEEKVLLDMKKRSGRYDPELLKKAEKVFLQKDGSARSFVTKLLPVEQLNEEMYLAEDVMSASGNILGSKNQKLTEALITTFKNYAINHQLKETISIITLGG